MRVHRFVPGVRGISGIFALVDEAGEIGNYIFRYALGDERLGDVLLGLLGHVHGKLVPDEAKQGTVEFFVEGCVEVFLQEFACLGELFEGQLGSLAVTCAGNVGPAGCNLTEAKPETKRCKYHQNCDYDICNRVDEELPWTAQCRFCADVPDVLVQILYALALNNEGVSAVLYRACSLGLRPLHRNVERIGLGGLVPAGLDVVVGILDRCDGEVSVAPWDERVLEGLAA